MLSYYIELIESIIFIIIFAAYVGCFILGGSIFQKDNLIGKGFNKVIKYADLPVIRLLPKVLYIFSRYSSLVTFSFRIVPELKDQNINIDLYNIIYIISFFISIANYAFALFMKPTPIKSKEPELLCEKDGNYYEKYDHYSRFFHVPIAKSNHFYYVLFGIFAMINSIVFNSLSIRSLIDRLRADRLVSWSPNRYLNSVILLAKVYKLDSKLSTMSVYEMILVFWGFSVLIDSTLMFLSGKSRYRLLNNPNMKYTSKRQRMTKKGMNNKGMTKKVKPKQKSEKQNEYFSKYEKLMYLE
ncbi:hypothetical protein TVAG_476890 [Trichomonas vaginalis G3]|uniref:Palmitoyltransferase n=1 Tax=Trichomonas vaginalis (strain ATCC PRA-98 / G3) TaxID=412133 RepID=A2DAB2_TRIV3|nr:DHHC palmitoyltransferase family [Trichomonas vaginalis G3]EAY22760.1 hypothetical protein TVAG_476890 [Trichomonas vaginalis G3]KAI5525571.1 DHHC palmitoyltransferase family [Trichomonas vaginalis G3]|eukprot:XP_001583746.1 hypothetical protein [Trichomonas vaginalis G3]